MTPTIESTIERRLLVNFGADPTVVQALLPAGFRPALVRDAAVVGICILRLANVRPTGTRVPFGVRSESAAHRMAVEWDADDGTTALGVYVPRRDTSSRLSSLLGGRVLAGVLRHADISVEERRGHLSVHVDGEDGLRLEVVARETSTWSSGLFASVEEASAFFHEGCVAYSPNPRHQAIDGVQLDSTAWIGSPMEVMRLHSSVLSDTHLFPTGSLVYDSALIVRDVRATWRSAGDRAAPRRVESSGRRG